MVLGRAGVPFGMVGMVFGGAGAVLDEVAVVLGWAGVALAGLDGCCNFNFFG